MGYLIWMMKLLSSTSLVGSRLGMRVLIPPNLAPHPLLSVGLVCLHILISQSIGKGRV